jgi:hypothetical protein
MSQSISGDDRTATEELIQSYCLFADEARFDDIAALLSEAEVFVADRRVSERSAPTVRAIFASISYPSACDDQYHYYVRRAGRCVVGLLLSMG